MYCLPRQGDGKAKSKTNQFPLAGSGIEGPGTLLSEKKPN